MTIRFSNAIRRAVRSTRRLVVAALLATAVTLASTLPALAMSAQEIISAYRLNQGGNQVIRIASTSAGDQVLYEIHVRTASGSVRVFYFDQNGNRR